MTIKLIWQGAGQELAHSGRDPLCEVDRDGGGVEQWLMCKKRSPGGEKERKATQKEQVKVWGHMFIHESIARYHYRYRNPNKLGDRLQVSKWGQIRLDYGWCISRNIVGYSSFCLVRHHEKEQSLPLPFILICLRVIGTMIFLVNQDDP